MKMVRHNDESIEIYSSLPALEEDSLLQDEAITRILEEGSVVNCVGSDEITAGFVEEVFGFGHWLDFTR